MEGEHRKGFLTPCSFLDLPRPQSALSLVTAMGSGRWSCFGGPRIVYEAHLPPLLESLLKPCKETTWTHFPEEHIEAHWLNRGSQAVELGLGPDLTIGSRVSPVALITCL